ncbi:cysteine-rich DPF motif domain-containing protein 1 [Bombina bombina]|uniref:cysteine-rich DPF motif domain-containing protein 1 n=1 Tax=Bombina bombina TaxID=8345 RepID=UPI00235ACEF2|nr:cysteine-rich DPF motif domain-containing protein 1 [Bombina bombina]
MELDESLQPKGIFECQLCRLSVPYTYFGQKPPNTHSLVLLEESFIMKDPFSPDKDAFLILGSPCSLCNRVVCVGTECSLFYAKRFCLPCVLKNKDGFPPEIRQDLDKRKSQSKS